MQRATAVTENACKSVISVAAVRNYLSATRARFAGGGADVRDGAELCGTARGVGAWPVRTRTQTQRKSCHKQRRWCQRFCSIEHTLCAEHHGTGLCCFGLRMTGGIAPLELPVADAPIAQPMSFFGSSGVTGRDLYGSILGSRNATSRGSGSSCERRIQKYKG